MKRIVVCIIALLGMVVTSQLVAQDKVLLPQDKRPEIDLGHVQPGPGAETLVNPSMPTRQLSATQKALSKLRQAKTDDDKAEAKQELKKALDDEYDKYLERCNAELEKMERKLEKLRDQVEKRREAKDDLVDLRLKMMENEVNGLGWPQQSGTSAIRGYHPQFLPRRTPPLPPFDSRPQLPLIEDIDKSSSSRLDKLKRSKAITKAMEGKVPSNVKIDRLLRQSRLQAMQAMGEPVDEIQLAPRVRRPGLAPPTIAAESIDEPEDSFLLPADNDETEIKDPEAEPNDESKTPRKGGRINQGSIGSEMTGGSTANLLS